ncbi:bifunctional proline dehydrogenase/L-glutamate gamma-semialdehyde dehydrogenase [Demequina sp. SO4-18]|uniref:bifunctional proline dehydrogenase/L-glutamate gamma-semialdehyde dehydrogenase n=1 Tax=Demequina sp. SO4-18 TaxID=3401026 RepID=UPI003B597B68
MAVPALTSVPTDPDRAVQQVRRWLDDSEGSRPRLGARIMGHALRSEGGLRYLTEVVDGLVRPEDPLVAAAALRRASAGADAHLPATLAWVSRAGAVACRIAPHLTVAIARRFVRALVGHLVVDARPRRLSRSLRRLRADGAQLNVNLLGEAVLGREEAARRVERTRALIVHPDVDYVSIKVSAATAPHSPWDVDGAVAEITATLLPLYEAARDAGGTFVNLDMEEYRDLEVTLAVFEHLMRDERLRGLSAGIVIQAYLPESSAALDRVQRLAAERIDAGGAPLRVRIVKGANLSMERVESELRGWSLAPWGSKAQTDAHYKRMLDAALTPESTRGLKVGIAGHNLFDVALAWDLANRRGVADDVQFEMLLGMGEPVASAVARDVGTLRLYTPVVDPADFDVALAYLVRRLEEVANPQNFLSRLPTLAHSQADFEREERAFREACALAAKPAPARSHRASPAVPRDHGAFRNASDSDPAVGSTRADGARVLARAASRQAGAQAVTEARIDDADTLSRAIGEVHAGGRRWGLTPASARAELLDRVADELERRRHDLVEVMASETGKTLDQSDPEVSEAIDFARYYANSARRLDEVSGAAAEPRALTVVTPPWNFPVAIPAGSTLAALAAGSAVILKPAEEARRCSAVLVDVLRGAGVDRDLVRLIDLDPRRLGHALIGDPRVDQVILTGAFETAQGFLDARPELRLHAETSGKNAMIITPSADLDLAVRDLVASAFGHAGQKCSAASLAVLVGSVADSPRLHRQLRDAVRSLRVGQATDPGTQMGPVIAEPSGKLHRGLTQLDDAETWWVEPQRVAEGLWSPGVRGWVEPGSFMHRVECFGPVLGIVRARDLDHAIALVNEVDYGLTSGIHTLDEGEIRSWIDAVEAGNLYVNKGTTGAIVQRQPFGGWKRSVVGPTVKAGGPHYVSTLTGWSRAPLPSDGGERTVLDPAVEATVGVADAAWVRVAAEADQREWARRFSVGHDPTGLTCEANVLRYVPVPAVIRWDGARAEDLVRVCAAMVRAGAKGRVSAAVDPPEGLADALESAGVPVMRESEDDAIAAVRASGQSRVRYVGDVADAWRGHADIAVFDGPVTSAPQLELLPFVREQAVSLTTHRYGTPFDPTERIAGELRRGTSLATLPLTPQR